MHVSFTEPVSPRYIHINPITNRVHMLVPVVGGQVISTDNTCKATVALKDFFDGAALRELNAYKNALVFDIALIEEANHQRALKEERLAQIEAYIDAVQAMKNSFGNAMGSLMRRPSNLYSIQLRPRNQDTQSRVINPAFNIERKNDSRGNPLSSLYSAMHRAFPNIKIAIHDPRTTLINNVLSALRVLSVPPNFETIQIVLNEQFEILFGFSIDFTKRTNGTLVLKEEIDTLMGFGIDATLKDYIDALLGVCAPNVWESIPTPPFL